MYVCMYYKESCITKKVNATSTWHQVFVHCTGSHVQVYRSENCFGPSELRVVKGVHITSVKGGPRYIYLDQTIIQCGPSSNSKCTEVKFILVQASCMC